MSSVAGKPEDPIHDTPMPLLAHLVELRRRLIWSAVAFIVAFFFCYHFSTADLLVPGQPAGRHPAVTAPGEDRRLIYTALYEAFFTYIKVAFFGGAFLGFPVIASQIYMFVAPGLYRSEKRAFLPFLIATPVLFLMRARRWPTTSSSRSRGGSSCRSRRRTAPAACRSSCRRRSANTSTW